mgnify:CR=1 FL=1
MVKLIGKMIAGAAYKSAVAGAGLASIWNVYQPKEPKCLRRG